VIKTKHKIPKSSQRVVALFERAFKFSYSAGIVLPYKEDALHARLFSLLSHHLVDKSPVCKVCESAERILNCQLAFVGKLSKNRGLCFLKGLGFSSWVKWAEGLLGLGIGCLQPVSWDFR
jgi:hypothetical protein